MPAREMCGQFAPTVFVTQLLGGAALERAFGFFGFDPAGAHPQNAHAVVQAHAAQSLGQRHQGRIAHGARCVGVFELFSTNANHIDDDTPLALEHLAVNGAGQVDVAKYFQLPTLPPSGLVDFKQSATWGVARVVDQDVDGPTISRQLIGRTRLAQVQRMGVHGHTVGLCQLLGQGGQDLGVARRQMQVAALTGQCDGDRTTNALRCAGDQRGLLFQSQIHGLPQARGGRSSIKSGLLVAWHDTA